MQDLGGEARTGHSEDAGRWDDNIKMNTREIGWSDMD
jgi:hypothetical protein